MHFAASRLHGAYLIEPERQVDERGYFARTWCREEFARHGIVTEWVQAGLSVNRCRGTLRGLHYQEAPWSEAKLIRCTRGAIYDVLVDVRPESPDYLQWWSMELSADNGFMIYAPPGLAHGFQTLADDTEVCYQMSRPYCPAAARGLRWDDPVLAIRWPGCAERIIAPRDLAWPLLPRDCGRALTGSRRVS